ncbi:MULTISPECIES: phosphate ABC transporter substrate-binding protein PstS [unclassified Corynebacterium]|uniref:phosphate ABC transporter substrate-binding protein PstS n=1 Tax=unclassified Corynebacterium TaxID=2624378 RepID=UPI0021679AC3|nr:MULTISPECIES: phosphate ABC transporter substrate-binding protein PstS [unclassified Corynebacterium]MCS4489912.1 phosphate ABC transporter substrate-binding protein PstS [Corynebacterium sp. ES2775-CONJ]MCS4491725.1 phosphate ABC transporter substrate-binding protein PstS [Corynebacterium sp. ES2715-CONJ3]MCS4531830.1 phosphate ABC transporter substrate-binding protein PstS [Corynebacterium sp. ES2730-CONJ]
MFSTTRRKALIIATASLAASLGLTACSEGGAGGEDAVQVQGLNETTGELKGEGASSQDNAMRVWAPLFEATGSALSYNPTGSGAGQKQFLASVVAFAGSDSPLQDNKKGINQIEEARTRCGGNDAWHLPMAIGPVAIAYNLPGVDITLSPTLVAEIFDGAITKWNDPKIAALNPDVALPDTGITVVFRADESGTSDNFMKFLSATADAAWPHEPSKQFPQGVGQGANKSSGVTDEVSAVEGAITYVESGYAKSKNLGVAKMDFGSGAVELNKDTVGKALDSVEFKGDGHDMVVDAKTLFAMNEPGAYPLVLTTYEIVCSTYPDDQSHDRDLVKNFLTVVLDQGQGQALEDAGYIPVQGEFKTKLAAAVEAIQ